MVRDHPLNGGCWVSPPLLGLGWDVGLQESDLPGEAGGIRAEIGGRHRQRMFEAVKILRSHTVGNLPGDHWCSKSSLCLSIKS